MRNRVRPESATNEGQTPRLRLDFILWLLPLVVMAVVGVALRGAIGKAPGSASPDSGAEGPSLRLGRLRPDHWGLPTLPGAYDFRSSEGLYPMGSASYRLPSGTAVTAAEFYRRELTAAGWEVIDLHAHTYPLPEGVRAPSGAGQASGRRLIAAHRGKNWLIIANFIERPSPGVAVDVSMGISRLSESPFRDGSSSRSPRR